MARHRTLAVARNAIISLEILRVEWRCFARLMAQYGGDRARSGSCMNRVPDAARNTDALATDRYQSSNEGICE
jgi:hypothetical protein